jgi:hypothetical protein
MSDPAIRYKASMELARWRAVYYKVELKSPKHKAAQRWLSSAAAELLDIVEVEHKPGGAMLAEGLDGRAGNIVPLEISRDAMLGIRYAIIGALIGQDDGKPSNQLERWDLLEAASKIGPDGILRRLIESEAKIPIDESVDEDEIMKAFEENEEKQDRRKDDAKVPEVKPEVKSEEKVDSKVPV